MKYIILVGDGMGDYPIAELGGKTPLEAADTPAMDGVARKGELYRLQTVPDNYSPGSDVANLSLLGYLPDQCYTGRAPLEAASMHVDLAPDETAFRCNLVTLENLGSDGRRMLDYSAGHISTDEAAEIINALQASLGNDMFHFYPGVSYRHLMVYKGAEMALETVPPHDYIDQDVTRHWAAYDSAPAFKKLLIDAQTLLAEHPVNQKRVAAGQAPASAIWLWGQGKAPSMKTLKERYNLSGALISAVDLLKGIGVYAGMEIINVPGATGYLDTNYQGKAQAALEAVTRHDFVFVHVEAPDETGHQGDLAKKMQAIEDFDRKIVQPILDGLEGRDYRLAVTMDHYTPISLRTHDARPVPIAICDSRHFGETGEGKYCEREAQDMPLLDNGAAFINKLLDR